MGAIFWFNQTTGCINGERIGYKYHILMLGSSLKKYSQIKVIKLARLTEKFYLYEALKIVNQPKL